MAAVQEPEDLESEGEDNPNRKEKKKKEVGYPSIQETVYRGRNTEVKLDESILTFDYDGRLGQARPFSQTTFAQRLSEFRAAPPVAPLKVLLWPCDPHGMSETESRVSSL